MSRDDFDIAWSDYKRPDVVIPFARHIHPPAGSPFKPRTAVQVQRDQDHLQSLSRNLEGALIGVMNAVDSRGLRIMLHSGPMTASRLHTELQDMVGRRGDTAISFAANCGHINSTWAHNCALLAHAFDAAAALEAFIGGERRQMRSGDHETNGIVFGHATYND